MSLIVENLIPRLKKFAQKTELKEALVDKVWVIYGDNDRIEYEFERNGAIAVSRNGNSYDGTWRILGSGRLKIKTDFTNNTLEFDFALPGLLVMKFSGDENMPFLLFDPQKILNGDISNFIIKLETESLTELIDPIQDEEFWDFIAIGFVVLLFMFLIVSIIK